MEYIMKDPSDTTTEDMKGPKCEDCGCVMDSWAKHWCEDCEPINEIIKHIEGIFPFEPTFTKSKHKGWWMAILPNGVELHLMYDYGQVLVLTNPEHEWDFVEASETEILKAATGLWK